MTNAMLLRKVPLVIRDVSSGGCSIESRTALQVGMVGWLDVEFEGERRFEWFRVARVSRIDGVFVAGAEFLPLSAAGADSLRSAIGRLRRSAAADTSTDGAGRSSGDLGNCEDGEPGAAADAFANTANSTRKIIEFLRWR